MFWAPFWSGLAKTEVEFNHDLIRLFLEDLEKVFDSFEYTMNAHQLLHLKDSVQRFSSLFCNNSFIYEAANGECRSLVNASFAVNEQIANQDQYRFNLDLDVPHQELSDRLKLCTIFYENQEG